MKRCMLITLAACLSVAADSPKDDGDKLQGLWAVVSRESSGQKNLVTTGMKVRFAGDKVIGEQMGRTFPLGTFKLDPAARPKAYDRIAEDPDATGTTVRYQGIYVLHGDDLRICVGRNERPTGFATKPGDGRSRMTYKREKPLP